MTITVATILHVVAACLMLIYIIHRMTVYVNATSASYIAMGALAIVCLILLSIAFTDSDQQTYGVVDDFPTTVRAVAVAIIVDGAAILDYDALYWKFHPDSPKVPFMSLVAAGAAIAINAALGIWPLFAQGG